MDAEASDLQVFSSIRNIIKIGIECPELHDEILVQLCKQVSTPFKIPEDYHKMQENGWFAIHVAANVLKPSKSFLKYFQAFIALAIEEYQFDGNCDIKRFSIGAEENLKASAFVVGLRRLPPSITELQCIKDGTQFSTAFYFEDGHTHSKEIQSGSTAGSIMKELAQSFELRDIQEWSIFESNGERERLIKPNEFICDIISEWEEVQTLRKIEESIQPKPDIFSPAQLLMAPFNSFFSSFARKKSMSVNPISQQNQSVAILSSPLPSTLEEPNSPTSPSFVSSRNSQPQRNASIYQPQRSNSISPAPRNGSIVSTSSLSVSTSQLGSQSSLNTPMKSAKKLSPMSPGLLTPLNNIRMVVRKRIFRDPTAKVKDQVEISFMYAQAVQEVARGNLVVSLATGLHLAALQLQSKYGDLDMEEAEYKLQVSGLIQNKRI